MQISALCYAAQLQLQQSCCRSKKWCSSCERRRGAEEAAALCKLSLSRRCAWRLCQIMSVYMLMTAMSVSVAF